jgi:hypothetical protein
MFIVHQNCDSELANDRTLPYNSYIVEYNDGTSTCYDIVITDKKVDIFDYYWDRYREDLIGFKQTEGRVNPKLWDGNKKQTKKKR